MERAEDTARIIRSYHDLVVDFPGDVVLRWEPLIAISGNVISVDVDPDDYSGESDGAAVPRRRSGNPGSIASCVAATRENLRTTREVIPREAWQTVNGLSHYTGSNAATAVRRQTRDRFLARVIDDSRRLDGVVDSTMTRANPVPPVPPRPADRARRHDDPGARRPRRRAAPAERDGGVRRAAATRCRTRSSGWACCDPCRRCRCTSARRAARSTARRSCGSCSSTRRSPGRCSAASTRSARSCSPCHPAQDVLAALDAAERVLADARPIARRGHRSTMRWTGSSSRSPASIVRSTTAGSPRDDRYLPRG
jgi:hypothetical protein